MVSGTDPNRVILTGENPFIRLSSREGGEFTTRSSFWRVILSPGGPGHVLFIESELTGGQPKVYSDNIAMARWVQDNLERYMHPPFGDRSLEVVEAEFESSGDVRSYWTETILSRDDDISMTWYDLGEPFRVGTEPGSSPTMPHGVYTVLIPAASARLVINGETASGRPFPQERGGAAGSTCCLAFSESWVSGA